MEKVVNQVGQTMEVAPQRKHTKVKISGRLYYVEGTSSVFEGSEFNPVLLADGTIIPHYEYNGQIIEISREEAKIKFSQVVNSLPHTSNFNFHRKFLDFATAGKKFYFDPVKNCIFFINSVSLCFSFWLTTGRRTVKILSGKK